jgi:hypothetical protein
MNFLIVQPRYLQVFTTLLLDCINCCEILVRDVSSDSIISYDPKNIRLGTHNLKSLYSQKNKYNNSNWILTLLL